MFRKKNLLSLTLPLILAAPSMVNAKFANNKQLAVAKGVALAVRDIPLLQMANNWL